MPSFSDNSCFVCEAYLRQSEELAILRLLVTSLLFVIVDGKSILMLCCM